MKCLVLAGGQGERMWPLSRKDYPKQFIQIQKNHSVFQETIARNIPYCDEFIIVTSYEYRFVVENQMEAFRGTPYRCIYEESPVEPYGAILLTCMGLRQSEFVFVVPAETVIEADADSDGEDKSYKDAILEAKNCARQGSIVSFGSRKDNKTLSMLLFQNGMFQKETKLLRTELWEQCLQARKLRQRRRRHIFYSEAALERIPAESLEEGLLKRTSRRRIVPVSFRWSTISRLEDMSRIDYETTGVNVVNDCTNTMVINNAPRLAVVVNGIDDAVVINTADAVYVSHRGSTDQIKDIIKNNPNLRSYVDKGVIQYRPWGYSEQLVQGRAYRIRQMTVLPGKTVLAHTHSQRRETWTIVSGRGLVTCNGEAREYGAEDNIQIPNGTEHQVTNIGEEPLVIVEVSMGEALPDEEVITGQMPVVPGTYDAMIKLQPAYKDSLWGGTKLRDIYGMNCDYDVIAESWQMSAHPAGQSIVASGRHKGLTFGDYLETVGKDVLGWKCESQIRFPMLVKFIDARENLSVQVHPNDDYALENEDEYGKNEMWYVVNADPGSGLYVGFNRNVTREEVLRRVEDNTITEVMNFYPTKAGDVYFIPAGTVHAIGAGNLICEIQQSSNSTYRLYDYGRVDKFGTPRELHLEKALDVLSYEKYTPTVRHTAPGVSGELLAQCKYFETLAYSVSGTQKLQLDSSTFSNVVCIRGSGELTLGDCMLPIKAGESVFIPAADGTLSVTGDLSFVLSHI